MIILHPKIPSLVEKPSRLHNFFKTDLLALDFWRTDNTYNNFKKCVHDFSNFRLGREKCGKKKLDFYIF